MYRITYQTVDIPNIWGELTSIAAYGIASITNTQVKEVAEILNDKRNWQFAIGTNPVIYSGDSILIKEFFPDFLSNDVRDAIVSCLHPNSIAIELFEAIVKHGQKVMFTRNEIQARLTVFNDSHFITIGDLNALWKMDLEDCHNVSTRRGSCSINRIATYHRNIADGDSSGDITLDWFITDAINNGAISISWAPVDVPIGIKNIRHMID